MCSTPFFGTLHNGIKRLLNALLLLHVHYRTFLMQLIEVAIDLPHVAKCVMMYYESLLYGTYMYMYMHINAYSQTWNMVISFTNP